MTDTLRRADLGLRRVLAGTTQALAGAPLAGVVLGCGFCYGAVMGSFGGDSGRQLVYSGVKVPLLLLASFAISMPSFFVLNTLLGVRQDFAEVRRAILGSQAGLAIVLAALAPYTALWYASWEDYNAAVLFNALMFALASFTAQVLLRRAYRPLVARSRQHQRLLRVWLLLYVFVAIQMAWVLRPFVGAPGVPAQFFRDEAWGNAYVVVGRIMVRAVTR